MIPGSVLRCVGVAAFVSLVFGMFWVQSAFAADPCWILVQRLCQISQPCGCDFGISVVPFSIARCSPSSSGAAGCSETGVEKWCYKQANCIVTEVPCPPNKPFLYVWGNPDALAYTVYKEPEAKLSGGQCD